MNGMSFSGGGGNGGQARGQAMNLATAPQISAGDNVTVKGDPGTNWIAELQKWVSDRASYPEFAAEMGQQGPVTVSFTVDRAGHVISLSMVQPTRYALLNEALMSLFRNMTVPPLSKDATSNTVTVEYTMQYVLEH